ncbi:hypothetical protein BH23GEM9_BH23GEM9_36520 [soil metagenome]
MRLAAVIAALLLAPARSFAQCPPPLLPPDAAGPCEERYPSWAGELAVLGGNAVLGGLSAGVLHKLRGGSFGDAFLRGVAGGAVIYGGKRIAVERFGGAGLVGREVAAVGSSMVRNAGEGRGVLEQIVLPVGPARLYLQNSRPRVRVRADLMNIGWLIYAIHERELRFDAGMSISAGAPVFMADDRIVFTGSDTAHAHGITEAGLIVIANVPAFGRDYIRRVFEHERVHVLQMDQLFMTVTGPAEERAVAAVPGVRRLAPYIDVNLASSLLRLLNGVIPDFLDRPWETEAIFMSR